MGLSALGLAPQGACGPLSVAARLPWVGARGGEDAPDQAQAPERALGPGRQTAEPRRRLLQTAAASSRSAHAAVYLRPASGVYGGVAAAPQRAPHLRQLVINESTSSEQSTSTIFIEKFVARSSLLIHSFRCIAFVAFDASKCCREKNNPPVKVHDRDCISKQILTAKISRPAVSTNAATPTGGSSAPTKEGLSLVASASGLLRLAAAGMLGSTSTRLRLPPATPASNRTCQNAVIQSMTCC